MKRSKELNNLVKAINEYIKKHNGNICLIGNLYAFNKEGEDIDSIILGYGDKGLIKESLKGLNKLTKEEKKEFINW